MVIRKMQLHGEHLRFVWIEETLFDGQIKIEGEGIFKSFSFRKEVTAKSFYDLGSA